jgi:hypothetical protein
MADTDNINARTNTTPSRHREAIAFIVALAAGETLRQAKCSPHREVTKSDLPRTAVFAMRAPIKSDGPPDNPQPAD